MQLWNLWKQRQKSNKRIWIQLEDLEYVTLLVPFIFLVEDEECENY
jgi:hypothetical protein